MNKIARPPLHLVVNLKKIQLFSENINFSLVLMESDIGKNLIK